MGINYPIVFKVDKKGLGEAENGLKGLGKSIAGFAGLAAGALAGIGIGKFFKDAVTDASDLDESINAVNKSYGEFSDDVLALGDDVASRLGLSTVDFNAAAVRFSAFAEKVVGEGGNVAGFVDDISTRAADFASVFNIDVSEALRVFQSGLSGEAEPLKRFGINLLQSEVNAYAAANGIGELGRELTENEKVQARYGLLLQTTAKTAGDFADTSDGLANSQRILGASLENLSATVGTSLTPVVANFVSALVPLAEFIFPKIQQFVDTKLTPSLDLLGYTFQTAVERFTAGDDLGLIIKGIFDPIDEFFANDGALVIFNAISGMREGIQSAFLEALPALLNAFLEFLPQLLGFITNTLLPAMIESFKVVIFDISKIVSELLPILVETLLKMVPDLVKSAIELFSSLVNAVVEITPLLVDTIVKLLPNLVDSILKMLPEILDAAIDLFMALVDALPKILPLLIKAIFDLLPEIISTVLKMLPELLVAAQTLFIGIASGLLKATPVIVSEILGLIPKIVSTLIGSIPKIVVAGFEIVKGLAKGIIDNAPRLLGEAIASLGNTLVDGISSFLGIRSPSRVFMGIGEDVVKGLETGLEEGQGMLATASVNMASNLKVSAESGLSGGFGGITRPTVPVASQGFSGASVTYQVNVNAGMGADGADIGRKIVDEILRFERSSGKVFARA
jgi:phage-related protein